MYPYATYVYDETETVAFFYFFMEKKTFSLLLEEIFPYEKLRLQSKVFDFSSSDFLLFCHKAHIQTYKERFLISVYLS